MLDDIDGRLGATIMSKADILGKTRMSGINYSTVIERGYLRVRFKKSPAPLSRYRMLESMFCSVDLQSDAM